MGRGTEYKFSCTLEELYTGKTKNIKITREIADAKGMQVEETLRINVKPGWKKGMKFVFQEKEPHSVFIRDGNDLIVVQEISLDGRYVIVSHVTGSWIIALYINEVIRPDYEQVFPTLGMPFWEDPTKNGMLRIKFNIIFPIHPTADQKAQINKVLSLPS
ncbi:hypothetical protein GLYMA_09G247800v4 [Glycine max]|uniref:Chaperone DnaJ C-terminal domain-containing protein n=1 Tax=Glycine max TaxID=3847 RepID=K7LFX5_SOYBN|nr:hypothetical protein JHK87_026048 [Glycine soja]KAG5008179.1 hypothetical protein JHK85_026721 [Glycine max]KRH40259.1 hypothetical protein GLYMA_09G247800v4 [Glycine max]